MIDFSDIRVQTTTSQNTYPFYVHENPSYRTLIGKAQFLDDNETRVQS